MSNFWRLSYCNRCFFKLRMRKYSVTGKLNKYQESPYLEKVLLKAEKILEDKSFRNVYWLVSDDISTLATHMQQARDIKHPIAETATSIAYSNDITLGMVLMLLSKITEMRVNEFWKSRTKINEVSDIHYSIAKVTEMFHLTMRVHKCLSTNSTVQGYGNKVAILCGDYLLGQCFSELANLRDYDLLEFMGSALRDLTMGQYVGLRDRNNIPYPSKPQLIKKDISFLDTFSCEPIQIQNSLYNCKSEWFLRNTLGSGGLLGKACFSVLKTAGYTEQLQNVAYSFGKYFNLAHQALKDIRDIYFAASSIDLTNLPIMLHLQNDEELYKHIEQCKGNVEELDFNFLRQKVLNSGALEEACDIKIQCANSAYSIIDTFDSCEAQDLLRDMVKYIQIDNV